MKSQDLRQAYLDFFKGHGHTVRPSSSLIPDDPSLLFTVAGMVPFKPMFLGQVKLEYTRATSCQKCIRTNDIENVGRTRRHHTFFEMLGNFSFGDYFKAEAIPWAWDFLTSPQWMGLPKDRLWISVFTDDDEAIGLWKKLGLPESRIVRMGADSNFWTMGPTGPCGPCSEIYYDFRPAADPSVKEGDLENGGNRYVEIWNNVFTQFDRQADGSLKPLPKKNIDTGMGLERLAAVKQGVWSNFDTDLFKPLIQQASDKAGLAYGQDNARDLSLRVIAEHARACAFLIADGVQPSNEGRGYVLRRILRRALRHGRLLGIQGLFLNESVDTVAAIMGGAYPELNERAAAIKSSIKAEEERFLKTLDSGLALLKDLLPQAKAQGLLSGDQAFKLYDTYGFPLELTQELAAEQGLAVDEKAFSLAMEAQRERARSAHEHGGHGEDRVYGQLAIRGLKTRFVGYAQMEAQASITALVGSSDSLEVVLDTTPFYAESGGQAGDTGTLSGEGFEAQVTATLKRAGGDVFAHRVKVLKGQAQEGLKLTAKVDVDRRRASQRHHSATHLLQAALRQVLGTHVEQSGSSVDAERLRFDFSHPQAMTAGEREQVERWVNARVWENAKADIRVMPIAEAKKSGAMALFGEKYGDAVRVVRFGDFSQEFCGGTHVAATGEIGAFKIVAESSVSSGIRRIEAVAGLAAYESFKAEQALLLAAAGALKSAPTELPLRVEKLLEREHELLKEIKKLKSQGGGSGTGDLLAQAVDAKGVKLLAAVVSDASPDDLKALGDQLKDKLGSGVVLLGSAVEDKVTLVAMVTKDLAGKISAGKLVAELAPLVGGRGGGKPEMAQAGGKDVSKLPQAIAAARAAVEKMVG
jgi:alanyl-tRNA synthetase